LVTAFKAFREALDPPTPVRIVISAAELASLVYVVAHLVQGFDAMHSMNMGIWFLFIVGTQLVNLLDIGWVPKKTRAKAELRRAESARWREAISEHNARVLALAPPPGTTAPGE
jgi:hypothetical protein